MLADIAIGYMTYDKLKLSANAEEYKEIIVTSLQMLAVTTGTCLLAWGIPFFPGIGFRIASGQHKNTAFKVGNDKDSGKRKHR